MRKRKAVEQRPEPLPKEPLVILLVRLRLEIAQHLFLKKRVIIYTVDVILMQYASSYSLGTYIVLLVQFHDGSPLDLVLHLGGGEELWMFAACHIDQETVRVLL